MKAKLYLAIKIAWMAAMVALLLWYAATNWGSFVAYANRIGPLALVASLGFLLAGKALLAQISLEALRIFAVRLPFWKAFSIYSLSQLGKYLPGSVWHFVGRVLLYRAEGLASKQGTKVVVIENFWLLGSAATIGIALCAERLLALSGLIPGLPGVAWATAAAAVLAAWLAALHYGTRLFASRLQGGRTSSTRVYALELTAWMLLGLSFWVLFPTESRSVETIPLAVGAFALGWAGGYLAPFAPAGIGVREAIIVGLLADMMTVPLAIAAVALSRLIWTAVELSLGAIAAGHYRPALAEFGGAPAAPATLVPLPRDNRRTLE